MFGTQTFSSLLQWHLTSPSKSRSLHHLACTRKCALFVNRRKRHRGKADKWIDLHVPPYPGSLSVQQESSTRTATDARECRLHPIRQYLWNIYHHAVYLQTFVAPQADDIGQDISRPCLCCHVGGHACDCLPQIMGAKVPNSLVSRQIQKQKCAKIICVKDLFGM